MDIKMNPKCYYSQDHLFEKHRQLRAIDACPQCLELGENCLVSSHRIDDCGEDIITEDCTDKDGISEYISAWTENVILLGRTFERLFEI